MGLISISKAKFNRARRNKRCTRLRCHESGIMYQCGKQIITHDVASHFYYKLTGQDALRAGYTAECLRRKMRK